MKYIKGSGGGKPQGARKPIRDPDNLNSRQFATIQDLLSEGEIEGFASASKQVLQKVQRPMTMQVSKMFF